MLKTIFINTFKFALAGGLIYWLLSSGKLDFKLLLELLQYPSSIFVAVLLTIFNFWLISFRWRQILSCRTKVDIPLTGLFKITWIGQFFSSVLPGSVSGDLVKILYVQQYEKELTKKFLFASILIDRVMGLSGLILLVGISSLLFSGHILENAPAMAPLISFNHILVVLVVVAFTTFLCLHRQIKTLLEKAKNLFLPTLWEKLITLWDDLVLLRSQLVKALLLSILVQFFGVVIFWSVIKPFVHDQMDFVQALAFIPLGQMTLALPIAPSGLGVGHAIFQKLFEFSKITNGASLFNNSFVLGLAINVIGVIPYILSKRKN